LSMAYQIKASPGETLAPINPSAHGLATGLVWTAGPDTADVGTTTFNFTTTDTQASQTFVVNITMSDVTEGLDGWGIGLIYDNTTLAYVAAKRPSDHVFSWLEGQGVSMQAPSVVLDSVDATHMIIKWGCAFIQPDPPLGPWGFNGTGTLCQIEFRIIGVVSQLHQLVTSTLVFDPSWTGVYYLTTGTTKQLPTLSAGSFSFRWLIPPTVPDLYVKQVGIPPAKIGDDVAFEVWVKDVNPAWGIIGFQFSLWYNMTLLNGTTSYEHPDTWMNAFATAADHGEAVVSLAFNDYIGAIDLPPNYNKWFAVTFLTPEFSTGTYYPPFPGAAIPGGGPEGMLFRFHMQANEVTTYPVLDTTTLEIHDILIYNQYGLKIGYSIPTNATYTAPQKVLGLSVDLYACRDGVLQREPQDMSEWVVPPPPYNGIGKNNPSDMYEPQAEVDLQALVTYNDWPVQQKLAGFTIQPPAGSSILPVYLENYTDVNGIAWIKFRLPWPCVDPWKDIFGVWTATVTVEVAKQIVNDTLQFVVYWPFEILNVTGIDVTQQKGGTPPDMKFTVWYRTYRMQQNLPLILTVDAFDNLGFHIGSAYANVTGKGWGNYTFDQFIYYTETFTIPLPTNAVVGPATVYANAFSDFPWNGGVPYCPEVSGTFSINKPP
jgi:hypothetical protein